MGSCPSCGAAVTDSEFQCRNCSGDSDADRLFAMNAEIERLKAKNVELLDHANAVNSDCEQLEAENATLKAQLAASEEKRKVWYNGPASGYATVVDDWMRKTFTEVGPRQITIEVRGEELTIKPHAASALEGA